jgi:hypothetical protein
MEVVRLVEIGSVLVALLARVGVIIRNKIFSFGIIGYRKL